jgi:hypothetical protein
MEKQYSKTALNARIGRLADGTRRGANLEPGTRRIAKIPLRQGKKLVRFSDARWYDDEKTSSLSLSSGEFIIA